MKTKFHFKSLFKKLNLIQNYSNHKFIIMNQIKKHFLPLINHFYHKKYGKYLYFIYFNYYYL